MPLIETVKVFVTLLLLVVMTNDDIDWLSFNAEVILNRSVLVVPKYRSVVKPITMVACSA